jgi:hypothetical protein
MLVRRPAGAGRFFANALGDRVPPERIQELDQVERWAILRKALGTSEAGRIILPTRSPPSVATAIYGVPGEIAFHSNH